MINNHVIICYYKMSQPFVDLDQSETHTNLLSDYETIKVIGQGAFGVVKLVRHKSSKKGNHSLCKSRLV